MRTESTRCSSLWTVIFILLLLPLGCATPTKPNIPYSYPIPQLDKIAQRNPLLATELRKLPEIQDGVSQSEASSLEKIVEVYDSVPDDFDRAFEQMYQVGIPKVRKYCSPLQTLFWLVEDGNTSLCNQVINEYDLRTLLIGGWTTEESIGIHSKIKEADRLEKMCIDQALKKQIFPYVLPGEVINEAIRYPEKFGMKEYNGLVVDEQFKKHKKRWGDFDTVVDRLNAPELIDHYEKYNIDYEYYRGDWKTNKSVFTSKRANCYDTTEFTLECLRRAGYKAGNVLVDVGEGHNICYYWNKGRLFVMDNEGPRKWIMGPYKSFKEIPYRIIEFVN